MLPILPQDQRQRFIPTCVGLISLGLNYTSNFPVHPHVRGVNVAIFSQFGFFGGSSPRAWG